jgi:hypothetical protein
LERGEDVAAPALTSIIVASANELPVPAEAPAIVEEMPKHGVDAPRPTKILVVDIGGTKIKVLASGQTEPRKTGSGKSLTPGKMVDAVKKLTTDWDYDAVSIGYPGMVGGHGPRSEPGNLGAGWVGFNFGAAFDRPVRLINDAAMQALGSYEGRTHAVPRTGHRASAPSSLNLWVESL